MISIGIYFGFEISNYNEIELDVVCCRSEFELHQQNANFKLRKLNETTKKMYALCIWICFLFSVIFRLFFLDRIVSFNLFSFAICFNYVGTVKRKYNDFNYFYKFNASIRTECVETCSMHILLFSKLKSRWFYTFGDGPMIQRCKSESKSNKLNGICFGDVVQPPRKLMSHIWEWEEARVCPLFVTHTEQK